MVFELMDGNLYQLIKDRNGIRLEETTTRSMVCVVLFFVVSIVFEYLTECRVHSIRSLNSGRLTVLSGLFFTMTDSRYSEDCNTCMPKVSCIAT